MSWISGFALFLIVWWLVFFMVLPWGVQPLPEQDISKGHAPGAPRRPRILIKAVVTTVIAALISVLIYRYLDCCAADLLSASTQGIA